MDLLLKYFGKVVVPDKQAITFYRLYLQLINSVLHLSADQTEALAHLCAYRQAMEEKLIDVTVRKWLQEKLSRSENAVNKLIAHLEKKGALSRSGEALFIHDKVYVAPVDHKPVRIIFDLDYR